jgi:glutamate 5-kinase
MGRVVDPHRIVVKIGTSTLTTPQGGVDRDYLASIATQVSALRAAGAEVVVVTSGAIAAGVEALGLTARPDDLTGLQAAAAVGQVALIDAYADALRAQGLATAQVLITRHDTAHRQAYLYACATLDRLLAMGVVPVVNENDTVAVDEIRFGDNDTLAALVGVMVKADLVVLLSDIEGVYDADPRMAEGAELVTHVADVTDELAAAAGGPGSAGGSGGMVTKIEAARVLAKAGIPMVVADGRRPDVVVDTARGAQIGTYFAPGEEAVAGRKLWIAYGRRPRATIGVDAGAVAAIVERGSSLLPAGVTGVDGTFDSGDAVSIAGPDGRVFARGLADLDAAELASVAGRNAAAIATAAPALSGRTVVHRDRLVVL